MASCGAWLSLGLLLSACTGREGSADARQDADATSELERRIRQLAAPHVDPAGVAGKAVGLVVGVSSPTVRTIVGLGVTSKGGSVPAGPTTVFEIGSVTKAYTGVLLGLELHRGGVQLGDAIDPVFPLGAPHFGAQAITLLDLATHTAGLPDMPTNLHSSEPGNPAAGYTAEDLATFMSSYELTVAPGTTFRYSNVGAGTLSYLLVQRAMATSYEALLQREIAQPLGASDTVIELSAEQQARRARGHRSGQPAPENNIGEPLKGSGAVRSTAADVLKLLDAALGSGDAMLVAAWQRALEPRRPSPFGINGRTGLLVNLEEAGGHTVYSKNGQTVGFSAQIIFTTSPRAAVVLLANSSDLATNGALRDLGLKILEELW